MTMRLERYNVGIRRSLRESFQAIFGHSEFRSVLDVLTRLRSSLTKAFILDHIPGQDENFYWILIDKVTVVKAEVPKHDENEAMDIRFEVIDRRAYQKKRLSIRTRRRLMCALELMMEHEQ